jgi:hypothetical protein
LPSGCATLVSLDVSENPLTTLVLPESQPAFVNVFPSTATLRSQGVAVYVYPLTISLTAGQPMVAGAFTLTLAGPPGPYRVQVTSDFSAWSDLDLVSNVVGSAAFTDTSAGQRPRSFYRVKLEP